MSNAIGTYLLRMDKRGRIFVKMPMRGYFGLSSEDDARAVCYVGFPDDNEIPALILINKEFAEMISGKTIDKDLEDFNKVSFEEPEEDSKKIQDLFRPLEIKSKRIQFSQSERKRLNLPDDDNRVIVQGAGVRFIVWPAGLFREKFPEKYERIADLEDDDD